jgi:hypothetical protein
MWVQLYHESGFEEAARAVRLSRQSVLLSDTIANILGEDDEILFNRLVKADEGEVGQPHTAGLQQIVYWLGINAPLYWWKQMDRYTVGFTQASASTMHNLMSRHLEQEDFEIIIPDNYLTYLNSLIDDGEFYTVNGLLPQSYLQERSVMMSLPTIIRVLSQRKNHKLREWNFFISEIKKQTEYPQLLPQ